MTKREEVTTRTEQWTSGLATAPRDAVFAVDAHAKGVMSQDGKEGRGGMVDGLVGTS